MKKRNWHERKNTRCWPADCELTNFHLTNDFLNQVYFQICHPPTFEPRMLLGQFACNLPFQTYFVRITETGRVRRILRDSETAVLVLFVDSGFLVFSLHGFSRFLDMSF